MRGFGKTLKIYKVRVSIPFKRESASQADSRSAATVGTSCSFHSLQTGKCIARFPREVRRCPHCPSVSIPFKRERALRGGVAIIKYTRTLGRCQLFFNGIGAVRKPHLPGRKNGQSIALLRTEPSSFDDTLLTANWQLATTPKRSAAYHASETQRSALP